VVAVACLRTSALHLLLPRKARHATTSARFSARPSPRRMSGTNPSTTTGASLSRRRHLSRWRAAHGGQALSMEAEHGRMGDGEQGRVAAERAAAEELQLARGDYVLQSAGTAKILSLLAGEAGQARIRWLMREMGVDAAAMLCRGEAKVCS